MNDDDGQPTKAPTKAGLAPETPGGDGGDALS
eukprot:SAG22_NODE_9852_length_566_cov_0.976445_1_plen_31_part_10